MFFDDVLDLLKSNNEIRVPENWSQGRTTYGGFSAAIIYQKIAQQVEQSKSLRNFDLSFSAPLFIDKPLTIKVELLREGRTISCYSARIEQEGNICVSAQAIFACGINASLNIDNIEKSDIAEKKHAVLLDTSSDIFPNFCRNFNLFFTDGDPMFSGSDKAGYAGWMNFKVPSKEMTLAHLIMLIDAWPPATSSCLPKPAALSTVNWSMRFIQPLEDISQDLAYLSQTEYSQAGMAYTKATISNDEGQVLVLSQQTTIAYE